MKTLLLVIDNLNQGGAETLLVEVLPDLSRNYRTILVTLSSECHFKENDIVCSKRYTLNVKRKTDFFTAARQMKRIIKDHKVDLIHSHLFYSTVLSRIATPSGIPLIYSIHSQYSKSLGQMEKLIEKITSRRRDIAIAVSQTVAMDYEKCFSPKSCINVLSNFVGEKYFSIKRKHTRTNDTLKLLAVGNVKKAKNYSYLINAFKILKGLPVTIDIYGSTFHPEFPQMQREIDINQLNIRFMGRCSDIQNQYEHYDGLVSCSTDEGFGLSVIEAMASGLPTFLSDIPVFREITRDTAIFFDLHSPESFKEAILNAVTEKNRLPELSKKSSVVAELYRKDNYLKQLNKIYAEHV